MTAQVQNTNLDIARQYVSIFNEMPMQAEKIKPFFDPEVVWQELPNLLAPAGKIIRQRDYTCYHPPAPPANGHKEA